MKTKNIWLYEKDLGWCIGVPYNTKKPIKCTVTRRNGSTTTEVVGNSTKLLRVVDNRTYRVYMWIQTPRTQTKKKSPDHYFFKHVRERSGDGTRVRPNSLFCALLNPLKHHGW